MFGQGYLCFSSVLENISLWMSVGLFSYPSNKISCEMQSEWGLWFSWTTL